MEVKQPDNCGYNNFSQYKRVSIIYEWDKLWEEDQLMKGSN
jgi:hypothetical protein